MIGRLMLLSTLPMEELASESVHVQEAVLRLLRVHSSNAYRGIHAKYLDVLQGEKEQRMKT